MLLLRVACGAVLMASVWAVCDGLIDDYGVSPATDRYVTGTWSTTTVSVTSEESSRSPLGELEFSIDRHGNRIDKAIGDYRVDPRGDLFEWHSPNTAVSRPADPST